MRKIIVEGRMCIGPHFSPGELHAIKNKVDDMQGLDTLADLLAIVGNPVRLKIIFLLFTLKELCVCDLSEILQMSDSAVSQHLRKLKDRHIIQSRKDAQTVYYSLVDKAFTHQLTDFFSLKNLQRKFDFISA